MRLGVRNPFGVLFDEGVELLLAVMEKGSPLVFKCCWYSLLGGGESWMLAA